MKTIEEARKHCKFVAGEIVNAVDAEVQLEIGRELHDWLTNPKRRDEM